ncbi:MAG: hypothetical protein OXP66_13880 [Candidatus Tectomicrobia bacterium]|nr:hypothetical protein [Candidatus Tectomicrobia bacterium]
MPKAGMVGAIFGVAIVALVLYLSLSFDEVRCEVCVEYKGQTECRTAGGADTETASRTARDNACAFLISSKTDAFLCGQGTPKSMSCQSQ